MLDFPPLPPRTRAAAQQPVPITSCRHQELLSFCPHSILFVGRRYLEISLPPSPRDRKLKSLLPWEAPKKFPLSELESSSHSPPSLVRSLDSGYSNRVPTSIVLEEPPPLVNFPNFNPFPELLSFLFRFSPEMALECCRNYLPTWYFTHYSLSEVPVYSSPTVSRAQNLVRSPPLEGLLTRDLSPHIRFFWYPRWT